MTCERFTEEDKHLEYESVFSPHRSPLSSHSHMSLDRIVVALRSLFGKLLYKGYKSVLENEERKLKSLHDLQSTLLIRSLISASV